MTHTPRKPFGSTRDEVSVVGQGTWYIDRGDRTAAASALRRGLDLGMTHIDTAEMYDDAELVVADAIEGRRDGVFLVSKVLPDNASRTGTVAACERSLARLRTDRLDCYLLHWPGNHPLEDTVAAFDTLQQAGKIRSWGVSNFDVDDLEALRPIAVPGAIACNQVLYHLQERAIEHRVIPWCEAHGVSVVAYSPFGHDRFPPPALNGRAGAAGDRGSARRHAPPGGAAVPHPPARRLCNPQGGQRNARGSERGGCRYSADGRRTHSDRRGLSARTPPSSAADAVAPGVAGVHRAGRTTSGPGVWASSSRTWAASAGEETWGDVCAARMVSSG